MSKTKTKVTFHRSCSRRKKHKVWPLQKAKARFSELINKVEQEGYQTITKNGRPVAVIVSTDEFEKMHKPEKNLIDFFQGAPFPEVDFDLERNKDFGRNNDL